MTDEDAQTVADLDPARIVHYTSRGNGGDTAVHVDSNCRHIIDATPLYSKPASVPMDSRPVCQECNGATSFGCEKGSDVNATRDALLSMDPDEAGLSALGDRERADGGAE